MIKGEVKTEKNKPIKCVTLGIFFLLIGISILPSISSTNITISQHVSISKTVIRVDDDGDGDYTSIQEAINNATEGDIIEVYSGTYYEAYMLMNKQLTLLGKNIELGNGTSSGKPVTIIDQGDRIFKVKTNNCSISGFHMEHCLRLWGASNNIIYDNIIQGFNINTGMSLNYYSNNNSIYNNYIEVNSVGIFILGHSENNNVYKNYISDGYGGIRVYNSNNNSIYQNKIINCGQYGIDLFMESEAQYGATVYENEISSSYCYYGIVITGKRNTIYNNNISNCEYGIYMEKLDSIPAGDCCINDVYENNIINSGKVGIHLRGVYTSDIYRNNITGGEKWGFEIEQSELNNIFENNVTNNSFGIIMWSCEDNTIYHNNFIGNSENARALGDPTRNYWNLGYTKDGGGNYWDDYIGKDSNGDGVGDKPYIIPDGDYNPFNNDRDKYPLMEPNGRPKTKTKSMGIQQITNTLIYRILEHFPILQKLLFYTRVI